MKGWVHEALKNHHEDSVPWGTDEMRKDVLRSVPAPWPWASCVQRKWESEFWGL